MDPSDFFEGGIVTVSAATYAVVKIERSDPDAFAMIRGGTETTVVVEEGCADEVAAVEIERGWKRLTFEMALPFELVGFLAWAVSALAVEDTSVFTLLAYSADYVPIREGDVAAAATKLESFRGVVEYTEDSGGGN